MAMEMEMSGCARVARLTTAPSTSSIILPTPNTRLHRHSCPATGSISTPVRRPNRRIPRAVNKEESPQVGPGLKEEEGALNLGRSGPGDILHVSNQSGGEEEEEVKRRRLRGRQLVRRSSLLAKQVISIGSALSLGFVSQIWVHTPSWVVVLVEVRPSLLSGESERFLLQDISRVGDVVLVEDESVCDSEVAMVGLDTLVGHGVVTPNGRAIGKVRGYSFNINSGDVESLELDSFGISIIPSSLVTTYRLLIEDVLDVLPDTIVVHEAAALRIQRLTKGFLGTQNIRSSVEDDDDDDDDDEEEEEEEQADYDDSVGLDQYPRRRKSNARQRFRPRERETEDDWELPKDYL